MNNPGERANRRRSSPAAALGLFAVTLFVSAGLLFSVQPMPPGGETPLAWLLGLLTATVAAPFIVASTSAPLLQHWFASAGHSASRDPYFLYSASNAGSLLALVSYPTLVEPHLRLSTQATLWTAGYAVLVGLTLACAVLVWRVAPSASLRRRSAASGERAPTARPCWGTRFRWLALAAVPSSWMLSVTAYLSTDVAAVPLTWVVPLSLYLLSFILVFGRMMGAVHRRLALLLSLLVIGQAFLMLTGGTNAMGVLIRREMISVDLPILALAAFHLTTFFVAALVCHGELADSRPAAASLTEFYFCISAGGVLGGMLNSLAAPALFTSLAEYPLAMVLACCLLPSPLKTGPTAEAKPAGRSRIFSPLTCDLIAAVGAGVAAALLLFCWTDGKPAWRYGLPLVAASPWVIRPARFALSIGAVLLVGGYFNESKSDVVFGERGFYGILRVTRSKIEVLPDNRAQIDSIYRLLHGSIRHGAQFHSANPEIRRLPLYYYFPTGPIGQVFTQFDNAGRRRIAVVGLGVGSLAGFGRERQEFTFYEIDPAVARIARNTDFFTYLSDSKAACRVVLGDARLSLAREPTGKFDLIVIDAFSGDAPPVHLLTREALALYLDKLADGGLVAFNISNNWLDLGPAMGLDCIGILNQLCQLVPHRFKPGEGRRSLNRLQHFQRLLLPQAVADQADQIEIVFDRVEPCLPLVDGLAQPLQPLLAPIELGLNESQRIIVIGQRCAEQFRRLRAHRGLLFQPRFPRCVDLLVLACDRTQFGRHPIEIRPSGAP